MIRHYIPFIQSRTDWPLVNSTYREAAGCRTTLQTFLGEGRQPFSDLKLWIDCEVDGLHFHRVNDPKDKTNPKYRDYISGFQGFDRIADVQFQRRPDKSGTESFVDAVLGKAASAVPNCDWLSVPQLPYVDNASRNKINKALAEAAGNWKSRQKFSGKLILPVILVKSGHADKKTTRNPTVQLALDCYEASGAKGIWVVDSTLDDQDGVANFESLRFPGIIKLHEELNSKLPAGPRKLAALIGDSILCFGLGD